MTGDDGLSQALHTEGEDTPCVWCRVRAAEAQLARQADRLRVLKTLVRTLERDVADAESQRREALADVELWQRAALQKVRTRRAIISRARRGEALDAIATDYDVPVEFVRTVASPCYDLGVDP